MRLHDNGVADFLDISEVAIADGLVAWYPLNGDAKDHTINRNDGTVYGAVPAAGVDGKLCYEFDGVDDYIGVDNTNNVNISNTDFTITCFIKNPGVASIHRGILTFDYGSYYKLEWYITTEGKQRIFIQQDPNTWYDGTADVGNNEWHLIVAKRLNDDLYFYNNGELSIIHSEVLRDFNNFNRLTKIGYRNSDRYFNGKIQDVRIYNRALSAEEIKILYDMTGPSLTTMKQSNNTVYLKGEIQETL
jgi:hypothetical protein